MADDLTAQLEFGRITPETCETLRAVWPLVDGAMVPLLDMMYAHILKQSELKALFTSEAMVASSRQRRSILHEHAGGGLGRRADQRVDR